jgi:hypothetical protein
LNSNTSLGIFTNLLRYVDGSKTVLPLDVDIVNQTNLQLYETADEYFLGQPLATDKAELLSRSRRFINDTQLIENSLKTRFSDVIMTSDADLYAFNSFLLQMKSMMQSSFYTNDDPTSATRFSLLLVSLNNLSTRLKVFRIMMLRDRLRHPDDYASSDNKQSFLSKVRSELAQATEAFFEEISISGTTPDALLSPEEYENLSVEEKSQLSSARSRSLQAQVIEEIKNSLNRATNQFLDDRSLVIDASFDFSPTDFIEESDLDLNDAADHQWDNFFSAAINAEQGTSNFTRELWSGSFDTIFATCGISNSYLRLNRDQRAFLYFNKWLDIIVNLPFKIEYDYTSVTARSDQTTRYTTYLKCYYSKSDFDELKNSLSLTLSGSYSLNEFTYYIENIQSIPRSILQDSQTCYDGVDYVYRYIMQAANLLNNAAGLAYTYTPVFGENLLNHYTSNAVLNLNRQTRFAFSQNTQYRNFSKDQFKTAEVLNGFLRYIQDDPEISSREDSFVLVCGIPYGMLDRLGAFSQNKVGYVDVTVTLRSIDGNASNDVKIVKTYPISAFIEHQLLSYNSTTNASNVQVLDATRLYELSPDRTFVVTNDIEEAAKKNELQSAALLNYIQLFYGLTLNQYVTSQTQITLPENQDVVSATDKLRTEIFSYRFSELIESRYVSTGVNSLKFSKDALISQALSGCVFDKVIAIPISAEILKQGRSGYLADILITIDTRFADRATPRRNAIAIGDTSSLVTTLQNSLRQTLSSAVATSFNNLGIS